MEFKKKSEKISLSELEVSVRTLDFITSLSISTLDELLSMPEINCTSMSKLELQEVFADFGVCYNGVFNTRASKIEIIQAYGGITERWDIIKSWLLENHPSLLLGFAEPAIESQIRKAESELDCALPNDYREFLGIHNGQKSDVEPMVWTCSLKSVEQLADNKKSISEIFDDPNESICHSINLAIKPIVWSKHWIPIGVSARGRDILCLDLDPTEQGNPGQVILTAFDTNNHLLLASSFREFLSLYFKQIQTGEIEIDFD